MGVVILKKERKADTRNMAGKITDIEEAESGKGNTDTDEEETEGRCY